MKQLSLYDIQCKLNEAGASDLVIDIIINDPSREIFLKAIHLARALLHEGNDKVHFFQFVQQSFYQRLKKKDIHEPFFKAISQRIQTAQNRLKSDMMSCNESKPKGGTPRHSVACSEALNRTVAKGRQQQRHSLNISTRISLPVINNNNFAAKYTAINIQFPRYSNDTYELYLFDFKTFKKSNASKLLLAIMESRHDSENAERVLQNMGNTDGGPKQLVVHALTLAYEMANSKQYEINVMRRELMRRASIRDRPKNVVSPQIKTSSVTLPEISVDSTGTISIHDELKVEEKYVSFDDESSTVDPKEVGHNIYILAHQLARHSPELTMWMDGNDEKKDVKTRNALNFYKKHTAQIEIVRRDRTLERVVFPIHEICSFITKETKQNVYNNTERDNQVNLKTILSPQKLIGNQTIKAHYDNDSLIALTFLLAHSDCYIKRTIIPEELNVCILIPSGSIVLFFWQNKYKILFQRDFLSSNIVTAISAVMLSMALLMVTLFGVVPALYIIGFLQLINKCIHLVAYVSNRGLEDKSWTERFADKEMHYHIGYLIICVLGLTVHPMLYSTLNFGVVEPINSSKVFLTAAWSIHSISAEPFAEHAVGHCHGGGLLLFLIHFVDFLTMLLCCDGFVKIQKVVVMIPLADQRTLHFGPSTARNDVGCHIESTFHHMS
uniref:STAS domain-containing protein n=1 Tax=Heterorhabditis bacteriophora TaxID=37862 RepID=A0A1I7WUH0_HETBA